MKKLIIVVFFVAFFAMPACAAEIFSFRNIELGMSEAEVRAFETGERLQTENFFAYAIKDMYNLEGVIAYIFDSSDKLAAITGFFKIPPTINANSKYIEIKTDFLEKYKNSINLSKVKDDGDGISFEIETLFKPNVYTILAITKNDDVDIVGFTFMKSTQ